MYWVQQLSAAPLIALAILLLSLVPARHVLQPLWPTSVDELVILEPDGRSAVREFVFEPDERPMGDRLLARTRPLSIAVVESADGRLVPGFPVALRPDSAAESLVDLPEAFSAPVVDPLPIKDGELTLLGANDQVMRMPVASMARLYYPNRLGLADRAWLLFRRVEDCWLGPCAAFDAASHEVVTDLN